MPEIVWGILIGAGAVAGVLLIYKWLFSFNQEAMYWRAKFIDEQSRRWGLERRANSQMLFRPLPPDKCLQEEMQFRVNLVHQEAQEKVNRAHQECGTALRQCHEREAALISRGGGR